jgi:hypothetical protein
MHPSVRRAHCLVLISIVTAAALLTAGAMAPPAALAVYGSPVVPQGEVALGLSTRQFTRDVYDVEQDELSNPDDTFGYGAMDAAIGIFREWAELDLLIGRAHNAQDRYPDRDYMTWNVGLGLRSRLYAAPSGRWDVIAGGAYRETIGFDRSESQTHKLERNYVAHGTIGRLFAVEEMPVRVYAGLIYSRHDFIEYGESYSSAHGAARGETRKNVELLGGGSVRVWRGLEGAGEIEYRETLSWALSADYRF